MTQNKTSQNVPDALQKTFDWIDAHQEEIVGVCQAK